METFTPDHCCVTNDHIAGEWRCCHDIELGVSHLQRDIVGLRCVFFVQAKATIIGRGVSLCHGWTELHVRSNDVHLMTLYARSSLLFTGL